MQNCPQNIDRVQFQFQSLRIIKHLINTKLYSIEFLRTEMTSDPQTITENTRLTARIIYFSLSHFCLQKLTRVQLCVL